MSRGPTLCYTVTTRLARWINWQPWHPKETPQREEATKSLMTSSDADLVRLHFKSHMLNLRLVLFTRDDQHGHRKWLKNSECGGLGIKCSTWFRLPAKTPAVGCWRSLDPKDPRS